MRGRVAKTKFRLRHKFSHERHSTTPFAEGVRPDAFPKRRRRPAGGIGPSAHFPGFRFLVGGVGENDSECVGQRGTPQEFKNFLRTNTALQIRLRQIFLDSRNRLSIFLDKKNRRCAAAERFDAEGTASSEKIKNFLTGDFVRQTGEDGSLDAIHRRAHAAFRHVELDSTGGTRDDSHGGEGVAVTAGDSESVAAAGVGVGVASSGCLAVASAGFLFLERSDFLPPKKPLTKSLRSRPTILSIKFDFGRSSVPAT